MIKGIFLILKYLGFIMFASSLYQLTGGTLEYYLMIIGIILYVESKDDVIKWLKMTV